VKAERAALRWLGRYVTEEGRLAAQGRSSLSLRSQS
jgi:hypothetical protein